MIGIDCINVLAYGANPKDIEPKDVINDKKNLILRFYRTKDESTYAASIIMPTIVHDTNVQGFGTHDCQHLCFATDFIRESFYQRLGIKDLRNVVVKSIEVNDNKSIPNKVHIDMIMDLMAFALISEKTPLIEHHRGKRYYKSLHTSVINGIKTHRDTSGRYVLIFYNKTYQSGIYDNGLPIVRLELEYNNRGIQKALKTQNDVIILEDILNEQAIKKLIQCYIFDVEKRIMPKIHSWFTDAVEKNIENLKKNSDAFSCYFFENAINKCDFEIFRTAYYQLHKETQNTARVNISRYKKKLTKMNIHVSDGTYKVIKGFERDIVSQKQIN